MIIYHKYRFIFIKSRKTAGTSIEVFLSQHCSKNDILTPISPPVAPHVDQNWQGFWNPIPELCRTRFRLARSTFREWIRRRRYYNHIPAILVRDRTAKELWKDYFKFTVDRNPWDKTLSHYLMVKKRRGNLSFDDYLKTGRFCINYRLYTDTDSELLVDDVVRYENLSTELGRIFGMLGIPFEGDLGVWAKLGRRPERHYWDLYTLEQRRIIERAFHRKLC